jgi:hypothetical protein
MIADVAGAAGGWATVGLFAMAIIGAGIGAHRWARNNIADPIKAIGPLQEKVETLATEVSGINYTLTVNGNRSDPPTILDRLQGVEQKTEKLAQGQEDIKRHLTRQDDTAATRG